MGEVIPGVTIYRASGRTNTTELIGAAWTGKKAAEALAHTGQHSTPPGQRSRFPSGEEWVCVARLSMVGHEESMCPTLARR